MTETISEDRLGSYLNASGHDPERALALYLWNAKMGEAFHVPIQAVEVALRNRVNYSLVALFGNEWWDHPTFQQSADADRQSDLALVFRRIKNRNLDATNGQVVAGLSFGFWVGMLQPRYNPPIWGSNLRISFPHLPSGKSRKSLAKRAGDIAYIRNRISHHEPIIKRDHSADYNLIMEFLTWVCPTKAEWVRPHCRIPEVWRQKP